MQKEPGSCKGSGTAGVLGGRSGRVRSGEVSVSQIREEKLVVGEDVLVVVDAELASKGTQVEHPLLWVITQVAM